MRTLAAQPSFDPLAPMPGATTMDDVGGPVAAIQRSIAERMAEGGSFEIAVARAPDDTIERTTRLLSRAAGPLALGIGYLLVAQFVLG